MGHQIGSPASRRTFKIACDEDTSMPVQSQASVCVHEGDTKDSDNAGCGVDGVECSVEQVEDMTVDITCSVSRKAGAQGVVLHMNLNLTEKNWRASCKLTHGSHATQLMLTCGH